MYIFGLNLFVSCGNDDYQFDRDPKTNDGAVSPDEPTTEGDSDIDGDGYSYDEEISAGTNPNFNSSHPYEFGGYNIGFCEDGVGESSGPSVEMSFDLPDDDTLYWQRYKDGDLVANLILLDQYGQEVELHSFCGQNIMLVLSSFT
jgi:hypothetical protein